MFRRITTIFAALFLSSVAYAAPDGGTRVKPPAQAQQEPDTPAGPYKTGTFPVPAMCMSKENMVEFLEGMEYDVIATGKAGTNGMAKMLYVISKSEHTMANVVIIKDTACLTNVVKDIEINKQQATRWYHNSIAHEE